MDQTPKRNYAQVSTSEEESTPVGKQKVRRIDDDVRLTEEAEEQQYFMAVCDALQ